MAEDAMGSSAAKGELVSAEQQVIMPTKPGILR